MNTVLTSMKEIKPRYIGSWLKDQMSRPDWFRNMVVNRSAWGAFSIYAHARRSDGKAKIAYITKVDAEENALKMSKKYGVRFVTYKCLFCDGWHVSKTSDRMPTSVEGKTPIEEYNPTGMNNQGGMDMEKILSLNIPDLAPVYGGLRGRTLSSARQYYAWRPLVDAGLRQIIDLRADYKSDAYRKRCEEFGISYYRYPVVRGGKLENEMADHFPELCALIDKGHFYIACAHGLHRTDIALCLYWVFYAADKGIAPPPIRGYREDKGLDTHKIMRALNGMYEYMTHRDGKEPMPIETFRKRKEIIKELSKIKLGTDRMTMSDEVRDKVVNVTGTDTDIVGYWRVVKVDLEEGTEFENEELFETRGEADASCEMCQKKWKEHAWDYREYLSMKYQVRFVSIEEIAEEKRQKLEKWHKYVRKTFVDPIVPATFTSCCQRLVATMQQKVDKLSKSDISKMRHDGKQLYCPWQTYGGGAMLWAYMQLEPSSQKVSFWGMFTKESLFGSISQRIEIFDCIAEFKTWIEDSNQAADILEKRLLDALNRNIDGDELPR